MEFRVAPHLASSGFAAWRLRLSESCFSGRSDDESRFLELCILRPEPADESSYQSVPELPGLTLDARSISVGSSHPANRLRFAFFN
jgi:hypothetical protein